MPLDRSISWRRVAVLGLALGMILAVTLGLPVATHQWRLAREREAAMPHPRPVSDEQQKAIVRAILQADASRMRGPPPPPAGGDLPPESIHESPQVMPALLARTLSLRGCEPVAPGSDVMYCEMGQHQGEELSSPFIELPVALAWRRELVQANLSSTVMPDPGVVGVKLASHAPPDHRDVIGFSRAVLSSDGREALVYFEHHEQMGAGCILYRLARVPTGWDVRQRVWLCVG